MGRFPATPLPCRNRSIISRLAALVSIQTVHAQGCTGAYWVNDWMPCEYGCIVDNDYPFAHTDGANGDPCSGHELENGYCGACDFVYDTAGCDTCG